MSHITTVEKAAETKKYKRRGYVYLLKKSSPNVRLYGLERIRKPGGIKAWEVHKISPKNNGVINILTFLAEETALQKYEELNKED